MAFHVVEKDGFSWVESDVLGVKHMFTRKLGGVGDFPYTSGPDPVWEAPEVQERVRTIWQGLRKAGAFPPEGFCFTRQVHGTVVRSVSPGDRRLPPLAVRPEDCDGLVTTEKRAPLCVFTADCVPVLLSDPEHGVICAAHSGWKGTAADMMGAAVRSMTGHGARPESIRAAIGPAISRCCFEVGPEVKEAIEALLGPDADGLCPAEEGVPGRYMADLKETNRRRLLQLGVRAEHIDVSADCTMCRSDLYWSHRATKGRRGTQAAIIELE